MIDIHSKGPYPADALSNFYPHSFIIDGVKCASMEGFLQSLKFGDVDEQVRVCALSGGDAKDAGLEQDWKSSQILYWQGRVYQRNSDAYANLITRAFDALTKNVAFQKALNDAGDEELGHSIGVDDMSDTVLTTDEFLSQLIRLRKNT
mgnify:CR=1 FL=1